MSLVTAIHLYVTDLDRSIDWYTRLLGRGPAAAYDEGENAHSAFFVLEGQTFLVLTWDPERGREIGGSARLELAGDDIEAEIDRLDRQGIQGGRVTKTRFGTKVYDLPIPTATSSASARRGRSTRSKAPSSRGGAYAGRTTRTSPGSRPTARTRRRASSTTALAPRQPASRHGLRCSAMRRTRLSRSRKTASMAKRMNHM